MKKPTKSHPLFGHLVGAKVYRGKTRLQLEKEYEVALRAVAKARTKKDRAKAMQALSRVSMQRARLRVELGIGRDRHEQQVREQESRQRAERKKRAAAEAAEAARRAERRARAAEVVGRAFNGLESYLVDAEGYRVDESELEDEDLAELLCDDDDEDDELVIRSTQDMLERNAAACMGTSVESNRRARESLRNATMVIKGDAST